MGDRSESDETRPSSTLSNKSDPDKSHPTTSRLGLPDLSERPASAAERLVYILGFGVWCRNIILEIMGGEGEVGVGQG